MEDGNYNDRQVNFGVNGRIQGEAGEIFHAQASDAVLDMYGRKTEDGKL